MLFRSGSVRIQVEAMVEPFIRIGDAETYETGELRAGDSITLNVEYHAGNGNTVISSDEGGIRFWLRHFAIASTAVWRSCTPASAGRKGSRSGNASAAARPGSCSVRDPLSSRRWPISD